MIEVISLSFGASLQCQQAINGVITNDYPAAERMKVVTGHGNYGYYRPLNTSYDPGNWDGCHQIGESIAQYCTLRVQKDDLLSETVRFFYLIYLIYLIY